MEPPGPGTVFVGDANTNAELIVYLSDDPEVLRRYSKTVSWTIHHLKRTYFKDDPQEIIDIYLFKDRDSYLGNTRELFHTVPSTPYGYYSPQNRALIMNISTGGGTLVHEMVHAFMPANFESCPPWLNEGLGSLYEACGEENG